MEQFGPKKFACIKLMTFTCCIGYLLFIVYYLLLKVVNKCSSIFLFFKIIYSFPSASRKQPKDIKLFILIFAKWLILKRNQHT